MFSFAACWLLSWFTMGNMIHGDSELLFDNASFLPPIVGSFTTVAAHVLDEGYENSRESGRYHTTCVRCCSRH